MGVLRSAKMGKHETAAVKNKKNMIVGGEKNLFGGGENVGWQMLQSITSVVLFQSMVVQKRIQQVGLTTWNSEFINTNGLSKLSPVIDSLNWFLFNICPPRTRSPTPPLFPTDIGSLVVRGHTDGFRWGWMHHL
jgi:hypothetical protein